MDIQGTFTAKVKLNGKVYGLFTSKNKSIIDIREIIGIENRKIKNGKMAKYPVFAETRPAPFIEDPDSIHPRMIDYYHTFYGRNI